jgi:hypothetical protein
LVDTYPEDKLEPDVRIFNRILTHDWRHAHGGLHGPHEPRYREAAKWVDQFHTYSGLLKEYCLYELEAPERFENLPLNRNRRLAASEYVRLLGVQQKMLERWLECGPVKPVKKTGDEFLRSRLKVLVEAESLKTVAVQVPCSQDTLSDFLRGITKPQEKVKQRLLKYAQAHKRLR